MSFPQYLRGGHPPRTAHLGVGPAARITFGWPADPAVESMGHADGMSAPDRDTHFDLAVIGSGSGNSLVTPDFDGKRVAVIESGRFGGTCLNVGCIPTKMYVYAADVAESARHASRYGVDASVDGVRWPDIRDRIYGRIDPISDAGRAWRVDGPNTTAYFGRARFTGPRCLSISTGKSDTGISRITADQVVIATGSSPTIPPVVAESGVAFHTSDTALRLERLPERLVIIGGGYIAAEAAHVYSALGVAVTVVARGSKLLSHLDADIADRFTELARRRWDVRLGVKVTSVLGDGSGGSEVRLDLSDGSTAAGDLLLVATGRGPNTADLDAAAGGVELRDDGRVLVDAFGRTSAPGVWSLGDVSSDYQLKHVANHEARMVAHNLVHPGDLRAFDHRYVPSAIFTSPQIASVGLTEQAARSQGRRFVTARQRFGDTAYGWAMEDTTGFAKVLADPATGELLGAHLIGPQSSNLIQPLIQAMSFGQRAHDVAKGQYWIHPALAEVVENVLLALDVD
jgi:mycothione reductase